MAVRRTLIRELVERLLHENGITGGAVDVKKIAASHDIDVIEDAVDDDLSGFLYRQTDGQKAIIGINSSHPPKRKRFTVAHELGHYFLHEGQAVHLDGERESFTLDRRDRVSTLGEDELEREANLFAAELLMPAKFLRAELQGKYVDLLDDDETLAELAERYDVSIQALTFRLNYLGRFLRF